MVLSGYMTNVSVCIMPPFQCLVQSGSKNQEKRYPPAAFVVFSSFLEGASFDGSITNDGMARGGQRLPLAIPHPATFLWCSLWSWHCDVLYKVDCHNWVVSWAMGERKRHISVWGRSNPSLATSSAAFTHTRVTVATGTASAILM